MNRRRRLLIAGAGVLGGFTGLPARARAVPRGSGYEVELINYLRVIRAKSTSALVVGHAVIQCTGQMVTARSVAKAILHRHGSELCGASSNQDFARRLRKAIGRDFEEGETISVQGLVLARTEGVAMRFRRSRFRGDITSFESARPMRLLVTCSVLWVLFVLSLDVTYDMFPRVSTGGLKILLVIWLVFALAKFMAQLTAVLIRKCQRRVAGARRTTTS